MKVYFIGAGPGDIQLLTLKAIKIIKKADLIIYAGSLINKDILKLVKNKARLYDSSKMTLEEILKTIKEAKNNCKIVARIHSGDPSIYGAIQEQMDWCQKNKIEYQVIPGVSSFSSAAASLKQELTLPGVSQTIILTRIGGKTPMPKNESLENLSKIKATLVIFLSIHKIEEIVKELKKGWPKDTPINIIEKASWPEEKIIKGTLENIVERVKKAGIKRQALIVVGNILRKKYQKTKLYDKRFEHSFRKIKR
jgi:precorrin-4/cobalt-precorrin-4 C11-methyltransferase